MRFVSSVVLIAAPLALICAAPAFAETGSESETEAGFEAGPDPVPQLPGHVITIAESDEGRSLVVDGETLLEDIIIFLEDSRQLAGQQVLSGLIGDGSNSCAMRPFFLTAPPGEGVRLDGPAETCRPVTITEADDRLILATDALPGRASERWSYSLSAGLTALEDAPFTPDPSQSWAGFAALGEAHPIEALGFAPVYHQLHAVLSDSDWADYTQIIGGLGSGDLTDQGYAGSACEKILCEEVYGWLWIDRDSETAVAGWISGEGAPARLIAAPADAALPGWIAAAAAEAFPAAP